MSKRPPANCRLTIDGNEVEAVVSPHIGQRGFSLWNDALGARAHFNDLAPGSTSLRDVLQQQAGKAFVVQLPDKNLGSIDEYRGYAAADMGPHTRRVTSLRLGLSHDNGRLAFRFEGTAGPVDPGSIFQGASTAFMHSPYRFEIGFEIARDDLPIYVEDQVALEAIQTYVESQR